MRAGFLLAVLGAAAGPSSSVAAAKTAQPAVAVGAHPVTVYDYAAESCATDDVPDLPVRALRGPTGQLSMMLPNWTNRVMTGSTFSGLTHSCTPTAFSTDDPDPAAWADRQWIASPYTTDGVHLVALVHDEYQGSTHPGQCPSGVYANCWYNALTLATSNDGGLTWSAPRGRLVAAVPYRYQPDGGTQGYMEPSNIVFDPSDGYDYATFLAMAEGAQTRGTCLMRTNDPTDPGSWRAWDGKGFSVSFIDPYSSTAGPTGHVCQPLDPKAIGEMTQSLTYSTVFKRFMLVGESTTTDHATGTAVSGVYYSLSTDLIHWSARTLILATQFPWDHSCSEPTALSYPSLIDPNSPSPTFGTVGVTADLYLTRFHYDAACNQTWDRDLIRYPVSLTR
jgi:hypothetical protein